MSSSIEGQGYGGRLMTKMTQHWCCMLVHCWSRFGIKIPIMWDLMKRMKDWKSMMGGEDVNDDNEDGEVEEEQQVYTLKIGKRKASGVRYRGRVKGWKTEG